MSLQSSVRSLESRKTLNLRLQTPDSCLWLRKIFYASTLKSELREVASVRAAAERLFLPIVRFIRARPIRLGPSRFGSAKDVVTKRCQSVRSRQAR